MELKKYFIKNKNRESIEAEEIFLDAEAIHSLDDKGKLEQPIKHRNFFLFYALIIACLLILFLRAGHLEIVKGEYYYNLAQGNRLRVYSLPAPRGIIYDHLGQPLVYNIPSFDLTVNLNDFLANPQSIQEEILEEIANLINQGESAVQIKKKMEEKIAQATGQVSQLIMAKNIDRSTSLVLESLVKDWPGWRLEKNPQRQYIEASYFAHLLGYTGQLSPDDLEEHPDYSRNEQIGKTGLELSYESVLRGQPGQEQVEVDSSGKSQNLLAAESAQPGRGLALFIDQELQKKLYQALEKTLKRLGISRKAAALAIDPRNGGVLALVSLPSFDNNLFAQGISLEDLVALKNDPANPFLNRVLAGQYPSGSTIKPLIAAAALEEEIINPTRQIDCRGGLSIPNQYNPQVIYHYPDWKVHGLTDIIKAIAQSCNVYFYTIGGGYGRIEGLGVDRIKEYLQYFGLGQASQIDLFGEKEGLVPDSAWKKEKKPDEEWYLGDTYHLAIGQGDILVTPLQMTVALASIANGGILYQPQIVDKIVDLGGETVEDMPAEIIRQGFIQEENIKIVRQGMRQAVLTGSARSLADLPVEVAGKTGTAQFGSSGQAHAWFIGYAPYEEPEIILTVLIEGGGEGSQVALPVAKEVLEWYFSQ
jgi:penicillin-binding protein 2